MDLVLVLVLGLVAFVAGGVAGALSALQVIARSGPVATAKALAEMEQLRLEWATVMEGLEELETTIERKRRRVAARESAEKRTNGAEPVPGSREELIKRARAQGAPV